MKMDGIDPSRICEIDGSGGKKAVEIPEDLKKYHRMLTNMKIPASAVQNKMKKVYIEWATGNVNFRPEGGGDTGREVRQHSAIVIDVLLLYCRVFGWSLKS